VSKGPLNYTTTIDATKSAAECIARLASHGASAIAMTYANKKPTGLQFSIVTVHGERQFSLPVNVDGTHKVLLAARKAGNISPRFADREQAERVAWRVLKDWLEAQLALIEAGVADMAEVMLPYLNVAPGLTLYQAYLENEQRAITAGSAS
jgi:predicted nucleotidyltransferase